MLDFLLVNAKGAKRSKLDFATIDARVVSGVQDQCAGLCKIAEQVKTRPAVRWRLS